MPLHRTAHLITNIHLEPQPAAGIIRAKSTWATHFHDPKRRQDHVFFGRSEHDLAAREGAWRIQRKRIVLLNDYVPSVLDIHLI
jgi:3-phenylpropionate/cinnamic acid dioxygenase small subunit